MRVEVGIVSVCVTTGRVTEPSSAGAPYRLTYANLHASTLLPVSQADRAPEPRSRHKFSSRVVGFMNLHG